MISCVPYKRKHVSLEYNTSKQNNGTNTRWYRATYQHNGLETGQTNGDGSGLLSQCFYSKGVAVTIVELPPGLETKVCVKSIAAHCKILKYSLFQ